MFVCRAKSCIKRAAACRPLSYGNPIACHLVGSVLRSRSKGEKEPHAALEPRVADTRASSTMEYFS
ncbi:unnamed protein product, partial [Staurois parvus]